MQMEINVMTENIIMKQVKYMRNTLSDSNVQFVDYIPLGYDLQKNGRIIITVPYCKSSLEFLVLYTTNDHLPDIVWPTQYSNFLPHSISFDDILNENVEKRLHFLVTSILKDFSIYQQDKLPADSDVRNSVYHCLNNEDFHIVEWQLLVNDTKQTPAKKLSNSPLVEFHVKIEMDTSDLPSFVVNNSDADFNLWLEAHFNSFNEVESINFCEFKIILPEFIRNIFKQHNIKMDTSAMKDSNLANAIFHYSHEIRQNLINLGTDISKREFFLTYMFSALTTHVLEFDSVKFEKASFLIEYQDFYCILEVYLNESFPLNAPKLYLRSVYYSENDNDKNSKALRTEINVPYTFNMSMPDLVNKILTILPGEINKFKMMR